MMLENDILAKAQAPSTMSQNQAKELPPPTIFCYKQSASALPSRPSSSVEKIAELLSLQGEAYSQQATRGNSSRKEKRNSKRQSQYRLAQDKESSVLPLKFCELDLEINAIEINSVCNTVLSSHGKTKATSRDLDFAAYRLAREQNPAFVDRPEFKVGFLRAERYDARKAARRMFRYLREKLDTFGRDKLTCSICPEDMGEDYLRYLELRDAKEADKKKDPMSGNVNSDDSIMNGSLVTLDDFDDEINQVLLDPLHLPEAVGGYCPIVPVDAGNGSSRDDGNPTEKSICNNDVLPEDVLLGRGRKHQGNTRFRELVGAYFKVYEKSKKQEQTKIAKDIVETIINDGGRFLEQSKGETTWTEIDQHKARLKVAHTFRSLRKKEKKKENTTTKVSSSSSSSSSKNKVLVAV